MNQTKTLVFATNNANKLREAREIVHDRFRILSLADINCHDEIPETAETLEGNALIKARWVHDRYGLDCFADDTGLMVDALDGAPGVYSARYAGPGCTPADNVRKLLHEMEGKENRDARFSTVVALIADGETHTFEGSVHGTITTEPSGTDGFGYDPIFRADESGRTFAEMSADEKNAISHRGRAMRKLAEFLGMLVLAVISFALPASAADNWRLHPTFNGDIANIIDLSDRTYFLNYVQPYNPEASMNKVPQIQILRRYKEDGTTDYLNALNLLTESIVSTAEYNYDHRYLMTAYPSGDIDIVHDDGTVKNVPGLKIADATLSRNINNISFDRDKDLAYLATDFGYLTVDGEKGVIESSRIFGEKVTAAIKFGGKLFLSTPEKLYYGNPDARELSELTEVEGFGPAWRMIALGDALYFLYGPEKSPKLATARAAADGTFDFADVNSRVTYKLFRNNDKLLANSWSILLSIDKAGKMSELRLSEEDGGKFCASYDGVNYWFPDGYDGYVCRRAPSGTQGSWQTTVQPFRPNASNVYRATSMAYHPDRGVLLRGTRYGADNSSRMLTYDFISGYRNMEWTPYSTTMLTDMPGLLIYTASGIAIDPQNKNHVYCGSHKTGMLRLDLSDPTKSIHMSRPSDLLGGNGKPGFAAIVDEATPDPNAIFHFSNPVFDTAGNLWTAYVDPDRNNGSTNVTELWYWTPEDRAATTSYTSVRPWHKVELDDFLSTGDLLLFAPSTQVNKNMLVFHGGSDESAMLIADTQGNPGNPAAWKSVTIHKFYDQDATDPNLWRPLCFAEDPSTGLVWIGHTSGVATIDLRANLENPGNVRRLKISRNDGTNLADYLLDGIQVNAIAIDKNGRKWFGTRGAGVVCTAADGRSILQSLTAEDSSLPDNTVNSMIYNPDSNSLIISTEKGVCEYFISGSAGGDENSARVYPNPVRPEFHGYVVIDSLPENCTVKITGIDGELIKDLGFAENGECKWDVTNLSHKRVPGGVYLVLASNGPDSDSFSKVSKILVIK